MVKKFLTIGAAMLSLATSAGEGLDSGYYNNLFIRNSLIERNEYNLEYKLPGKFEAVEFITIHNTAEPFSARQERDRVDLRRDHVSLSYHFAVDENEAVQILDLSEHGWHAGDGRGNGNMRSIGIEICRSQCYGENAFLYYSAEENAVKLSAWLLDHFGLESTALRRHYDWTKKYCPHRILDAGSWELFIRRVERSLADLRLAKAGKYDDQSLGTGVMIRSGKEGSLRYETTRGDVFPTPEALIEHLQANKISKVMFSSWVGGIDGKAILEKLQNAGLEVEGFYVLDDELPDWKRVNLLQTDRP